MNQQDRNILHRMRQAMDAVPGVRNPMDTHGKSVCYLDMSEVRVYMRRILGALTDADPDYQTENKAESTKALGELECFIALRASQDWKRPEQSPWKYQHHA